MSDPPGRWHRRRTMRFLYILRCADNARYIGETDNLAARLTKHNEGTAATFTATRRPVVLVHSETFGSRAGALARERQIKRWTRAKQEALISGDLVKLKRL